MFKQKSEATSLSALLLRSPDVVLPRIELGSKV